MRARLTYLALSPRTPQAIARKALEAGVLLLAILGMVLVLSGAASRAIVAGILAGSDVLGFVA